MEQIFANVFTTANITVNICGFLCTAYIFGTNICGKISIKIGGKMSTNIGAESGGKISGKSCGKISGQIGGKIVE